MAYVRGSNEVWYEMDDEEVRQVKQKTLLKQQAYILFYARAVWPCDARCAVNLAPRGLLNVGAATPDAGDPLGPCGRSCAGGEQGDADAD